MAFIKVWTTARCGDETGFSALSCEELIGGRVFVAARGSRCEKYAIGVLCGLLKKPPSVQYGFFQETVHGRMM
jgi:hypothetical protein